VVTEMRQHSGEVEARNPFPCVLMLPRSAPFRCSKRKDPASIFRQTRRADHDLTHAFTVFVNGVRESQAASSLKPGETVGCKRLRPLADYIQL